MIAKHRVSLPVRATRDPQPTVNGEAIDEAGVDQQRAVLVVWGLPPASTRARVSTIAVDCPFA